MTSEPVKTEAPAEEPDTSADTSRKRAESTRTVLDIGGAYMLKTASVSKWHERFTRYARRTPTEICLPAIGWAGPFFDSSVQPPPAFLETSDPLRRWVSDARDLLGSKGTIWAKVMIDGGFLKHSHLFLKNQFGMHLSQVCLANPTVQSVMEVLISEIFDRGVDGIVFDVTDCYPNSNSTALNDVSIHCFCGFCQDQMRTAGFPLEAGEFIGPSSLMRVVLRSSETGTSHIDPSGEVIKLRDATALLEQARVRDFVDASDEEALRAAERALEYCDARASVTASGVRALGRAVRAHDRRAAAILGSVNFDQSQQVTLDHLSADPAVDEVWVDDAAESMGDALPLLCYMASRSSYYLNDFFELLEKPDELLGVVGMDGFLRRLQESLNRASRMNELSPASVFVGGLSPQYQGVVGVPVFQDEHLELVESLTRDVTGQGLPREVLDMFRLAAGPAAVSSVE